MRIGVYSGSFNPVHNGHIALVNYILGQDIVDEAWLIRSPQNPLKIREERMNNSDEHRAEMLRLSIEGQKGLKISTVEDHLPRPNYTINTLNKLKEDNPEHEFYLIIGADNWEIFDRWYDYESILKNFHVIVYPRPGYEVPNINTETYPTVQLVDAPLYDISSTRIRELCSKGKSIKKLVSPSVEKYIKTNKLYNNKNKNE